MEEGGGPVMSKRGKVGSPWGEEGGWGLIVRWTEAGPAYCVQSRGPRARFVSRGAKGIGKSEAVNPLTGKEQENGRTLGTQESSTKNDDKKYWKCSTQTRPFRVMGGTGGNHLLSKNRLGPAKLTDHVEGRKTKETNRREK